MPRDPCSAGVRLPRRDAVETHPERLDRLRRYAGWLDGGFRVPGTRFRIGLDPILGLVPGLGDAAGALLATGLFAEGIRRGVPRATLVRIASNIALDFLIGAVPLLGDLFDFGWKANLRNVALLERHAVNPAGARRGDRLFVVLLGGSLLLVLALLILGSASLMSWLLFGRA